VISYLCYGTYSINHLTGTVSLLPMDRNRPCEVKKVFGNFLYWGKNKNTLEERERERERESDRERERALLVGTVWSITGGLGRRPRTVLLSIPLFFFSLVTRPENKLGVQPVLHSSPQVFG